MNFPRDLLDIDEDITGLDYFALKGIPRVKYTTATKTDKSTTSKPNKPIASIERAILNTKMPSIITETSSSAVNLQTKQRDTPVNAITKAPIIESNKENRIDARKPPRKPLEKPKDTNSNLPKYTSQKITPLKVDPSPVVNAVREKSQSTSNPRAKSLFTRSNTSNSKSGLNSSAMNGSFEKEREVVPEKKPKKDLSPLFINPSAFQRHGAPYFIVHFEGVLGTIHHMLPASMRLNSEKYLLRANLKKELRMISRTFIIIIIFPADNERYKRMLRYLLKNQFSIDGAYYISRSTKDTKKGPYLLDYNQIVTDFRIKNNSKVLIMQSFDDSSRELRNKVKQSRTQMKPKVQLDTPKALSSFYRKFPIAKISPENLRILMIPNFYLDEKYDRLMLSPELLGSRVITNCLNYVHENHFNNEEDDNSSGGVDHQASSIQELSSPDLRSDISGLKNQRNEFYGNSPVSRLGTEENKGVGAAEGENKGIQGISLVELFHLDFQKVVNAMDKNHQRNALMKEFSRIKKSNNQDRPKATLDTALMRMRITNYLAKKYSAYEFGKNIGEYLQIGDLIARNTATIAEIENEDFMRNPNHLLNLKEITNLLEAEKENRDKRSESGRKEGLSYRRKTTEENSKPVSNNAELEKKFLDCFILCHSE